MTYSIIRTFILTIAVLLSSAALAGTTPNPFPDQQAWPASCASIVATTPRVGGDVRAPIRDRQQEPVEDLSRFHIRCLDLSPVYELLIDTDGKVQCSRILRITRGKPPAGLYDAVTRSLKKMTFKPATLHGKPVAVLMSITVCYRCQ
jgi:hypothetical protein